MINGHLLKNYQKKDNSATIHHKNLHKLATGMFKVYNITINFINERTRTAKFEKQSRFCNSSC